MWQVKLCGQWLNLDDFEETEKAYCQNKEFSDEIHLVSKNIYFQEMMAIIYNRK